MKATPQVRLIEFCSWLPISKFTSTMLCDYNCSSFGVIIWFDGNCIKWARNCPWTSVNQLISRIRNGSLFRIYGWIIPFRWLVFFFYFGFASHHLLLRDVFHQTEWLNWLRVILLSLPISRNAILLVRPVLLPLVITSDYLFRCSSLSCRWYWWWWWFVAFPLLSHILLEIPWNGAMVWKTNVYPLNRRDVFFLFVVVDGFRISLIAFPLRWVHTSSRAQAHTSWLLRNGAGDVAARPLFLAHQSGNGTRWGAHIFIDLYSFSPVSCIHSIVVP